MSPRPVPCRWRNTGRGLGPGQGNEKREAKGAGGEGTPDTSKPLATSQQGLRVASDHRCATASGVTLAQHWWVRMRSSSKGPSEAAVAPFGRQAFWASLSAGPRSPSFGPGQRGGPPHVILGSPRILTAPLELPEPRPPQGNSLPAAPSETSCTYGQLSAAELLATWTAPSRLRGRFGASAAPLPTLDSIKRSVHSRQNWW